MSYCIKHEEGTWHTKPEDCPMCQLEAENIKWLRIAQGFERENEALREAVGNLLNDNSPQNREDVYALLEADDE